MRFVFAMVVFVVGCGGIGWLIWKNYRHEKCRRDKIIEDIRGRMKTYSLNEEGTYYVLQEDESNEVISDKQETQGEHDDRSNCRRGNDEIREIGREVERG